MTIVIAVVSQAGFARAQAVDDGEQAYRSQCQSCRSLAADGKPGAIAPNLRGVVGRKASATAFRNYSPALKKYKVVWDVKTLEAFLANPARMVPGTRMVAVAGDAEQRQAIIQYLARQIGVHRQRGRNHIALKRAKSLECRTGGNVTERYI